MTKVVPALLYVKPLYSKYEATLAAWLRFYCQWTLPLLGREPGLKRKASDWETKLQLWSLFIGFSQSKLIQSSFVGCLKLDIHCYLVGLSSGGSY